MSVYLTSTPTAIDAHLQIKCVCSVFFLGIKTLVYSWISVKKNFLCNFKCHILAICMVDCAQIWYMVDCVQIQDITFG